MSTRLERFTHKAREEPRLRFNALMGLLFDREGLRESFERQDGRKAPGVDGMRKEQYGEGLDERLEELSARLRRLGYRPKPVRRVYIAKGDGRYRPLGVPSFEDRLVQDRLSGILQAIWEPEFCDSSFGFRPGRSAHDALRRVAEVITNEGTQWVVEADIKGFFDHVSHSHLVKFLEHRIADPKLLRVVQRYLKAGVMEDGVFTASEEGTPQGGLVTPLTQKTTSSLNAGLRGGGSCGCLILDANSTTLMSHGAIYASTEGETIERGLSITRASDEPGGGSRQIVGRERDFIAPCLSLSRGSRTARATAQGRRACAADHLQNPGKRDSCIAHVCRRQRPDLERGCDARHQGVRGASTPRWLSGCASARSVSNTPSIDCSPPSSSRSTKFSFPIACEARVRLRR